MIILSDEKVIELIRLTDNYNDEIETFIESMIIRYKDENDLNTSVRVVYNNKIYITGNRYRTVVDLLDEQGRFIQQVDIAKVYSIRSKLS
jgi:hypothetical protein